MCCYALFAAVLFYTGFECQKYWILGFFALIRINYGNQTTGLYDFTSNNQPAMET